MEDQLVMATLALQPSSQSAPPTSAAAKVWSFKTLLEDVKRYLWRYGTATDVETDPIELLKQAADALSNRERLFEAEGDMIEKLEKENAQLKAELAAAKAKLPPWWKG
jgi:hypothetical protein